MRNTIEQEIIDRLADRYTAAEIAEYLDISVYDLLEAYYDLLPAWMLDEVTR